MGTKKKELGVDGAGIQKVMRKRDYLADGGGQLAISLISNMVGQLTYFYTDKVGLAVGGVGAVMMISKIVDALTDIWFGNMIDHSKGGNEKYYKWLLRMLVPAVAVMILIFTVPIQAGQMPALAYALITNILLSAVIYTLIATPYSASMVIRTNSQEERSTMGVVRAVGSYASGMVIAIATIPITNMLGGTQTAWIKFGVLAALVLALTLLICYRNGIKAVRNQQQKDSVAVQQEEEEAVPFAQAVKYLFGNKYWVIVLLFNLITSVTNNIVGASGTYYCKWIFGDDNLVAIVGALGLIPVVIGFILSSPIIKKFGTKKTVYIGTLGVAIMSGIRCFVPANFTVYIATGLVSSLCQIPLMCLYGVLLAMVVDYNEYKYDKKLLAVSSGAVAFGSKVGGGLGSMILSAFLVIGAYDASLAVATSSMRYAIYGFSNYLPLVINVIMFLVFTKFDLEERLPKIQKELEERRTKKQTNADNA